MPSRTWTDKVDLHRIHRTLSEMEHGEKSDYAQSVADRLDISKSTLYRALQDRFGKQKESPKEAQVPDDLIRTIAEIKETYADAITLKNSSRSLSTEAARDIAVSEGHEEAGEWSISALNEGLRRLGYHLDDPRTRVEADYSLQQVQVDFSRSKHFQVVEPTGEDDWLLEVSAKELHYKEGGAKLRTWVVQMRDEYSRLRLIRYYPATSESGILGVDFLRWAFNRPEDHHPMRHLPERIKTDQGAFAKSTVGTTAMEALDITPILASPESSASQGKVERGFRSLWEGFEAQMATRLVRRHGEGCTIRLSTLREAVHAWTVQEAQKDHPFYRSRTRGEMYRTSLERRSRRVEDWPRRVDHDVLDLATRTWTRTVDKTRLLYVEGVPFEAPVYATGHRVRVHRTAAGDWYATLVDGYHKGETFELTPYDVQALDDWEDTPNQVPRQDVREDVRDHLAQLGSDETPDVEDTAAEPEAPATGADEADDVQRLSLLEARARVGRALGTIDDKADLIQELVDQGVLYDQMPAHEADDIATRLTHAQTA